MKRFGLNLAGVAIGVLVIASVFITVDGLHDRLGKADVGVVLGNKVEANGQPSLALAGRLDEALDLYRQGYFPKLFVSGAFGKEGFPEATVMRDYLVRHGVPAAAIIVDNHGDDTHLTALNAARWMRANGLHRAMAISQYYHLPRTRLAFHRCGIAEVYSAHARLFLWRDAYAIPREVVGYPVYWLSKGRCEP